MQAPVCIDKFAYASFIYRGVGVVFMEHIQAFIVYANIHLHMLIFKQKTAYAIKECDWSSDVCSSNLIERGDPRHRRPVSRSGYCALRLSHQPSRSEERRVGKEGRSRRAPYH